MNLDTQRKPLSQDNSMIPLINVVFLMLAFFMIVGQIQSSDAVRLDPPESLSDRTQGEYAATVLVTVRRSLYLDDRPLRQEQLVGEVRLLLESAPDPQGVRVLVKADAALPATDLRKVLAHLRSAGLLRVSLATEATGIDTP